MADDKSKSKAQMLADLLGIDDGEAVIHREAIAAELRRLDAENAALRAEVERLTSDIERYVRAASELGAEVERLRVELSAAVAAEREECAQVAAATVCDTHLPTGFRIYGTRAADNIRARGKA